MIIILFSPTGIFGVLTKKAIINPSPINKTKIKNCIFPASNIQVNNFTNTGDKKYPNDPAQVTIPVAIVLLEAGKCFATTETGIPIAVPPKSNSN